MPFGAGTGLHGDVCHPYDSSRMTDALASIEGARNNRLRDLRGEAVSTDAAS